MRTMLKVSKTGTVKLTKGDTAAFEVVILDLLSDEPAKEYELGEFDHLTMTIRRNVSDVGPAVIVKHVIGTPIIQFEPADTGNLDVGVYVYDVELRTEDGGTYTIIEPKKFRLMPEVTRHVYPSN